MIKINNNEIIKESERADRDMEKDPALPKSIPKILDKIDSGEWVIPEFQRDFVWSIDKFKLLFDSIFKGYTIGNLLLWKSNENLAYRKVGSNKILKNNSKKQLCYILDGQQRLTTLYGTLKGKELYKSGNKNPKKYKICFDMVSNEFLSERDKVKINNEEYRLKDILLENPFRFIDLAQIFDENLKFPDNIIEKKRKEITNELKKTNDIKQFEEETNVLNENKKILEKFVNIIKSYKIHRIEEEDKLSKVVNVFERINTQNVKLDIFDIMVAKTYKSINYDNLEKTFNLRYAIKKILYSGSKIDKKNINPEISLNYEDDEFYHNIDNTTILRLISIISNKNNKKSGLQKDHIYNLKAQYLQDNITLFRKVLEDLLKYLSNELNIRSLDVKFTDNKMLSFLTSIISSDKYMNLAKDGKIQLLNKWFWNTMIFDRYPGAQLQRIESDINSFNEGIKCFSEQIKNNRNIGIFNKNYKFNNRYLINAGYNKQNKLYKALILLLNSLKPIDFNANSEINLMEYFGKYTQNNKHHIIPFKSKAADELRNKYGKKKADILLNNIGNIAIISSELNQNINNKNPESYLKQFKEDHPNFNNFLKRHLIDENMFKILTINKNYEEFILLRSEKIINLIKTNCLMKDDKIIFEYFKEGED